VAARPKLSELWLLRHAAVQGEDRAIGWHDIELSAAGRSSLHRCAHLLPFTEFQLHSSDLQRARATAEAIAHHFGRAVQISAHWRELYFGAAEGRRWQELQERETAAMTDWGQHWLHRGLLGGESFADLIKRAAQALTRLSDAVSSDAAPLGPPALVVSHAGMMRAILALANHWPPARAMRHPIAYLGLRRVRLHAPVAHYWQRWQGSFLTPGAHDDSPDSVM